MLRYTRNFLMKARPTSGSANRKWKVIAPSAAISLARCATAMVRTRPIPATRTLRGLRSASSFLLCTNTSKIHGPDRPWRNIRQIQDLRRDRVLTVCRCRVLVTAPAPANRLLLQSSQERLRIVPYEILLARSAHIDAGRL